MNIGILGASSHIAQGLVHNLSSKHEFYLFSRRAGVGYRRYGSIWKKDLDVIINCVGVGTNPKDLSDYFTVTEKFDNMALEYLDSKPKTIYISLSSGVVNMIDSISPNNYYGIARLNAEAKHRSMKKLNIVDLRLYNYFSRFFNIKDDYFINDVVIAASTKQTLVTSDKDMFRDFVHPKDLAQMITKVSKIRSINRSINVYSAGLTSKKSIIDYFVKEYGLKVRFVKKKRFSPTGQKESYFPTVLNGKEIGYNPKYTSLEAIKKEASWLLLKKDGK